MKDESQQKNIFLHKKVRKADVSNVKVIQGNILETFGKRLKYAREIRGLLQSELSEKMGKKNNTEVSLWELDKRIPTLLTLRKIAEVLKVSIEWLLHGTGDMEAGKDPFEGAENPKSFVSLRVIGSVSAGKFTTLLDESGELETYEITRSALPEKDHELPEEELRKKYFVFFVSGDSMYPRYMHGDRVLVTRLSDPLNQIKHGDVVIACTPENNTVLKRVKKTNGDYLLVSDNQEYTGEILVTELTKPVGKVLAGFYGKM